MQPKFNLWLEQDGQVVLSPWRVRLLETIDSVGSISGAALALDLPYRRAWERVHEIETRLGAKVLETIVGGAYGGGARLTPAARSAIAQFRAFEQGFDTEIARRYKRAYPDESPVNDSRRVGALRDRDATA